MEKGGFNGFNGFGENAGFDGIGVIGGLKPTLQPTLRLAKNSKQQTEKRKKKKEKRKKKKACLTTGFLLIPIFAD
ncbi:hypothetical protein [Neisseria lactamica]|uniref:hypothetical protein n=1 Tax=Neisseria lactamica TaxID=486 RepID=UPI001864BD3A|nr:hypothetical protein [Neisseria lactamica]